MRNQLGATASVLTLLLFAGGCGTVPHEHRYPALEGGQRFLCCTTRFNEDRVANDGGYRHEKGTTLSAGTPVQVIGDEDHVVVIQPAGSAEHYFLKFRFGRLVMRPDDYFQMVLPDRDPREADTAPERAAAIAEGRLVPGMTKAEVITTRGYPPLHHTPDRNADRWVYFDTGDDTIEAHFQNGRLETTVAGKAVDLPAPVTR